MTDSQFVYFLCSMVAIALFTVFLVLRAIKDPVQNDNVLELTRKTDSKHLRIDLVVYLGVPENTKVSSSRLAQNMRLFANKVEKKELQGYGNVKIPSTDTEVSYMIDTWI